MFEIGKVADTVASLMYLTGKELSVIWKYYIHDLVKEGHTLEEVKKYIEHKQELGNGADNLD